MFIYSFFQDNICQSFCQNNQETLKKNYFPFPGKRRNLKRKNYHRLNQQV